MVLDQIIQNIGFLLKGKATLEQEEEVRLWLEENEENRILYRQICETYYKLTYAEQWKNIDVVVASNKVKRRMQRGTKLWGYRLLSIAAVVVICLGITLLYWDREQHTLPTQIVENEVVESGEMKAVLTLANGKKIELGATDKVNVDLGFAVAVDDSVAGLKYHFKDSSIAPLEYNILTVPRAGEYIMVLADGTKVWLNSETELRYPVVFETSKREVYLKGEAFFEVTKNPKAPFIVHTPQTETTVLGTSFNVMAYEDERRTEITLVTGIVEVNAGDQNCKITPGQQLAVDNESLKMCQQEVNIAFFTSWKDGLFDFDHMTLSELCVKLSRWYDVDFFFAKQSVAEKRFTGAMKRSNNLQFMLDFIRKTSGVRFEMKGKTIQIYD